MGNFVDDWRREGWRDQAMREKRQQGRDTGSPGTWNRQDRLDVDKAAEKKETEWGEKHGK